MRRFFVALLALLAIAIVAPVYAGSGKGHHTSASTPAMHRYLVKRTFPAGALAGLDLKTKNKVNSTNAKFHVKWIRSYANADKTTTFCVYEGPNEQAIRDAAKANGLPVDDIFEVPVTLMPHSKDLVVK
jgi:Nickel responsive protein SCO4226-like